MSRKGTGVGVGGPAPKPTELKVLNGTRKDRVNHTTPKPMRVMPEQPPWLRPEAVELWDDIGPRLHKLGLLTEVDGEAFAAYCEAWATYVQAQRDVVKHGQMVIGSTGTWIRSPAVQIMRDSSALMLQYAQQFGLTPSARSRLSGEEPPESDVERLLS